MNPLRGVTVLDISRLLPGGFASLLLLDLGAKIIKVEQPGVGDYYRAIASQKERPFHSFLGDQVDVINRGKESLGLDLKTPEGREIFLKLVKRCDVVLENFRPGVLKKLKLDYSALKKINPSVILCSITGLGQKGPQSGLAGHDLNYLGLSGLLPLIRDEEGKMVIPDFQIIDVAAGYDVAMKISAALFSRTKTRKGCWIDGAMIGAGFSLSRLYTKRSHSKLIRYGIYETADGKWMTLAALEPKFWIGFCKTIGHPEWADGAERFESFGEEKKAELKRIFRMKTAREWTEIGAEQDFCLFPVMEAQELQFPSRGKTPSLGEQTSKILCSIGYKPAQIRKLKAKGVVE